MNRPLTREEWWALKPAEPDPDERQLARLKEILLKPVPTAHATLAAFTDVMCEGSKEYREECRTAWSLGFQTALGIAMQEPEAIRRFFDEYRREVVQDFGVTLHDLEEEDRGDADYFLDLWLAKQRGRTP